MHRSIYLWLKKCFVSAGDTNDQIASELVVLVLVLAPRACQPVFSLQLFAKQKEQNWSALKQRMVCNGFKRIIKTCGVWKHYVFILSCNPLAFNFRFLSCKITSCSLFSRFMPPPNVGGYRPGAGRGYPGRHMRSFTR